VPATPNHQVSMVSPGARQIGGSARGYQELSAPLAIPPRPSRQRQRRMFHA